MRKTLTLLSGLIAFSSVANAASVASVKTLEHNPIIAQSEGFRDLNDNDKKEALCLALAVYHEAGNQKEKGQRAVAFTVRNRTELGIYPDTYCGVVFQKVHGRSQYNFTSGGVARLKPRDEDQWNDAWRVALRVYRGDAADPVKGATSFYNPKISKLSLRGERLGDHVFYRARGHK